MLGMIKKDLYMMLNNRRSILFVIVPYFALSLVSEMNYSAFIPFLAFMMFMSSFSYDEYNRWYAYGATLPEGRKNIVKAKYLACTIYVAIFAVISILLTLGVSAIRKNMILSDFLSFLSGSLFALIILKSVLFPVIFRFGYEKARIILLIFSCAAAGLVTVVTHLPGISVNQELLSVLERYGIYACILLIAAAEYVSCRISLKIFQEKEF